MDAHGEERAEIPTAVVEHRPPGVGSIGAKLIAYRRFLIRRKKQCPSFGFLRLGNTLDRVHGEKPVPDGAVQHRVERCPISVASSGRPLVEESVKETIYVCCGDAV
jgi:hypothetical protein